MHLSIVVPTYNERENIEELIRRIHKALGGKGYEVIVVDDRSSDGTAEIVNSLPKKLCARAFIRKGKRSLSRSLLEGFKKAKGEIPCAIDGDLQHPPEIIPDLLKEIERGSDIVVASRYSKGSSIKEWGLGRKIISKTAAFLAKTLIPPARVTGDPLSGFFAIRNSVVTEEISPIGYKMLLEILVKGEYSEVSEIPYEFVGRTKGRSKMKLAEVGKFLRHLRLLRKSGKGK